ncbi:MAG: CrcB family protein [Actinophytocola sp.]|uniref:CrcB family protein n=1 Tax=Actinophytocola sp. TaxID=1872138 RepID=UPI003D6BE597
MVRPFLATGVLGGFTTFPTCAVEVRALLRPEWMVLAAAYLAGTVLAARAATAAGSALLGALAGV